MKIIFSFPFFFLFCLCLAAQTREEAYRRDNNHHHYEQSQKQKEQASADDGSGLILLGLIGLGYYASTRSSPSRSSSYTSSRRTLRRVSRAPAMTLGFGVQLRNPGITEEFATGFSPELRGDFLLVGTRGRGLKFGLYANAGLINFRHRLKYTEEQFFLGTDFIADGNTDQLYEVSTTATDRTQRIHLQDRSFYAGGSIKLMTTSGAFVEGGVGVIINRKSSLKFREGFDYLNADASLASYKFDNMLTSTNEGIIGFINNSFIDFGVGTILQGNSSPCQVRLYGKLFPLNYELTESDKFNGVLVADDSGPRQFDFQKRQQFSVGIEFAFILGRFSRY